MVDDFFEFDWPDGPLAASVKRAAKMDAVTRLQKDLSNEVGRRKQLQQWVYALIDASPRRLREHAAARLADPAGISSARPLWDLVLARTDFISQSPAQGIVTEGGDAIGGSGERSELEPGPAEPDAPQLTLEQRQSLVTEQFRAALRHEEDQHG